MQDIAASFLDVYTHTKLPASFIGHCPDFTHLLQHKLIGLNTVTFDDADRLLRYMLLFL